MDELILNAIEYISYEASELIKIDCSIYDTTELEYDLWNTSDIDLQKQIFQKIITYKNTLSGIREREMFKLGREYTIKAGTIVNITKSPES